jgi:transaldolase
MKLFLDTAIYDEIKQGVDWGVIDGVTTNPTLIAKAGQDYETQVKKICGIIGNVSAEVVSETRDDILIEGRRLASWHKNVIVKVPMTPDGLAAGKGLAAEGTRVNVTLCFSVNQALLAAAIGAYIISPFVARLDDINEDGLQLVRDIVTAYRQQDITTKVLAASLRGPFHVSQSALAGADIGTMPFTVLAAMFKHPLTDAGLKRFKEDYLKSQEAKPAQEPARINSAASVAGSSDARPSAERLADQLWAEHATLAAQLALLESVADAIGEERLPPEMLRAEVDRAYDLVVQKVLPHIRTADDLQRGIVRHDDAQTPVHPDHDEAERLSSTLAGFRARVARGEIEGAPREIRRILYELHALTRPHFADAGQPR